MPRETFHDPTVSGRYAQINWSRRADTSSDEPQYVQISTHHDGVSTVSELLGQAIGLLSNVDAPGAGWPNQSDEWREVVTAWLDRAAKSARETTGEYVQVGPDEIADMVKTLHKSNRQAYGDGVKRTGPMVNVYGEELGLVPNINVTVPAGVTPEQVARAVSEHFARHPWAGA